MRILWFLLFTSTFSFAQTSNLDSLALAVSSQTEDTSKVNLLNEMAWKYRRTNGELAHKHAKQAERLSLKIGFNKGYVNSLLRQGTIYENENEYILAEKIYTKILGLSSKTVSTYGKTRAQSQLASIFRKRGETQKSLNYYKLAEAGFIELDDKNNLAIVLSNISRVYKNLGDFDSALKYLYKSMELRKEIGQFNKLSKNHLDLGALYFDMGNFDQALENYFTSEKEYRDENNKRQLSVVYQNIALVYANTERWEDALEYYSKSLTLKKELGIENKNPLIYSNIGSLYYRKKDYKKALSYYLKADSIQNLLSKEGIIDFNVYNDLGNIYLSQKNYNSAIKFYKKALDGSIQFNDAKVQKKVTKNLSICYAEIGDFAKAFKYSSEHIALLEKLEANYKKAIQRDVKYKEKLKGTELLLKDKKFALMKLKEASKTKDRIQNGVIYSLLIGSVLLMITFFAFYRSRQHRHQALIADKNMRFEQQKTQELMKDMELKSLNSMLEGQEEERQRIAADLHDRLGSMLSMVKLHFESMDDQIDQIKHRNKTQYKMASELLDNACAEVRKIAHNMISGVLDKFGLVAALEDLSDTLNQSEKVTVEFIPFGMDSRLDRNLEITLYRIVQELISNTLKHANAKEITIQLLQSKNNLNLIVEDDGIGFDQESRSTPGMGLKNMASRVHHINGELKIDSSPRTGTTITIDIPNQ